MTKWSQQLWLTILVVILASTSSVVVGCSPSTPIPSSTSKFSYQVRVQAGGTDETIPDAVVTIEVEGQAPLDGVTDSKGIARIFISSVYADQPGFLIVEAKGYKRYTQHIDLSMGTLPDVVLLERSATVTPTPTFTPTLYVGPPTEAPTPTFTPVATATLTSPAFTHTPTRTETPTDTPVFTCTPTRTKTPKTTSIATNTPTLTPTPAPSYIIEFRASKTVVNPGEWVIFDWHVENVQAVYLDWQGGVGAPGDGRDSRQIWETADHTLCVVLQNGETVTRTITITVNK